MKTKMCITLASVITGIVLPIVSEAQAVENMQQALEQTYTQMIPMSKDLIDIGRGIAGFGALWYIAHRVWPHFVNAQPIDFYPLFRPFAIGMAILLFPSLLGVMNGVLQPTVSGTAAMIGNSRTAMERVMEGRQQEIMEPQGEIGVDGGPDPSKWYQYTHPDSQQTSPGNTVQQAPNPIANASFGFGIRNMFRKFIAELLYLFYQAAALCLNTIRIFKLIVLAILGPIALGLSVFDGFQHTLKHWLARYINVYLWLPIANIFAAIIAKVQENIVAMDAAGSGFNSTNTAYLIFLLLGTVGYFTVPSIANYIVHAGGHALLRKSAGLASIAVSGSLSSVSGSAVTKFFQRKSSKTK